MIKLWGRANSINVQKVLWCLDELGLAYDRTDAGGAFGGNNEDWYLAMNPNGRVPTFDDGGTILWESNTIVRYLAAKYPEAGLAPDDPGERARGERWMDWQLGTLQTPMTLVFWGLIRTAPEKRDTKAIANAADQCAALYAILDNHLKNNEFVGGAAFSQADIPVGAMTYRWTQLDVVHPDFPALKRWQAALAERPGFATHVMQPLT